MSLADFTDAIQIREVPNSDHRILKCDLTRRLPEALGGFAFCGGLYR